MRYQGTTQDVETIVSEVLAKANCMVVKQLPRESALATGQLMITTGKDWYIFDLNIRMDKRIDTGWIEVNNKESLKRLCQISQYITTTISHMKDSPRNNGNVAQAYNGLPVPVVNKER